jgi:hypothetical protein
MHRKKVAGWDPQSWPECCVEQKMSLTHVQNQAPLPCIILPVTVPAEVSQLPHLLFLTVCWTETTSGKNLE